MNTTLEPVGILKRYCQDALNPEQRIMLAEDKLGHPLETVCREAGLPLDMISLYIVNGQVQSRDYRLQRGDRIKCVAIVGGG